MRVKRLEHLRSSFAPFVADGKLDLPGMLDALKGEFDSERLLVHPFEKSRPEHTMDFHRGADNGMCLRVPDRHRISGCVPHPLKRGLTGPN